MEMMMEKLYLNQNVLEGGILFHSFNDKNEKRDLSEVPIKISEIQMG
jgi:hypothetical protein